MPLRNLIFHNFWLKLSSIVLGTVIWMAIHYSIDHDFALSEPTRETIRVPVSVNAQPGDGRRIKITPADVSITVVAEQSALHGDERGNIKAYVDLTGFRSQTATEEDVHADVPRNVKLIKIDPSSVHVEQIPP